MAGIFSDRITLIILVVHFAVLYLRVNCGGNSLSDEYLIVNQKECFASRKVLSCIKYRTAKILWSLATNRFNYFEIEDSKSRYVNDVGLRFVQLEEPSEVGMFADARTTEGDSELSKGWKFLKRTIEKFLQQHGIMLQLNGDTGARIKDDATESRGDKKKKKWLIILPLIILMKIAHLKMTLVPLTLGIGAVQLFLLVGGAYIIHYLKKNTLCKIHPHLVHTHSHVWDSEPEYSSFAGPGGGHHSGGYSSGYGGGYSRDWASSKAYSGYNYLDTISKPA